MAVGKRRRDLDDFHRELLQFKTFTDSVKHDYAVFLKEEAGMVSEQHTVHIAYVLGIKCWMSDGRPCFLDYGRKADRITMHLLENNRPIAVAFILSYITCCLRASHSVIIVNQGVFL